MKRDIKPHAKYCIKASTKGISYDFTVCLSTNGNLWEISQYISPQYIIR